MNEPDETQAPPIDCFRCSNGCIHVQCYNVTLTLKPRDFLALADAISDMRFQLGHDDGGESGLLPTSADSLIN